MTDERLRPAVTSWLRDTDAPTHDLNESVRRAMANVQRAPQLGRWRWLPSFERTQASAPTTSDTIDYQPRSVPATNGQTPTLNGRTKSMFSPAKTITAGALVFAIGGALLLAGPLGEHHGSTPAAQGTQPAPVVVEGRIPYGIETSRPAVNSIPDADLIEERGQRLEGLIVEMSDARLEGTVTIDISTDQYRGSGSTPTVAVFTDVLRIENDAGAWQGHPTVGVRFPGSSTVDTIVLGGDGAYEGLTAVLELTQGPGYFTVAGAVFAGDPPPSPAE